MTVYKPQEQIISSVTGAAENVPRQTHQRETWW
jgi:hypothetical protein